MNVHYRTAAKNAALVIRSPRRAQPNRRRHREAERLRGGLEVDHQLELGRETAPAARSPCAHAQCEELIDGACRTHLPIRVIGAVWWRMVHAVPINASGRRPAKIRSS